MCAWKTQRKNSHNIAINISGLHSTLHVIVWFVMIDVLIFFTLLSNLYTIYYFNWIIRHKLHMWQQWYINKSKVNSLPIFSKQNSSNLKTFFALAIWWTKQMIHLVSISTELFVVLFEFDNFFVLALYSLELCSGGRKRSQKMNLQALVLRLFCRRQLSFEYVPCILKWTRISFEK